ncbi:MAG: tripartite tricarboxylate transporter permease, partial [Bilophila wadsworthia]
MGIIIGARPGLSATLGVAILLPVTYFLSPIEGMLLLLGIYTGGIYGGSIAAILLNIPGCPASLMTTLDGYPMSQRGEGGRAIGIATVSSFIGGTVGVLALIFISPLLARAALSFGPAEYALLALFGLSAIVVVVAKSILKGFIAACIGLMLATVGMDPLVSVERFSYGNYDLLGGINYIPVVIGLFGLCEVFTQAMETEQAKAVRQAVRRVF